MTVVIDASVALKWVLREPDSAQANALLDRPLQAPDFWRVEVTNGLWKAVGRGEMTVAEAVAGLEALDIAPVIVTPATELLTDALENGARLKHAIYDCLYLALAIRLGVPLITADGKFLRVLRAEPTLARRVVMLADFEP